MTGKTLVVELTMCDEKSMHVAMKTVCKVVGIEEISINSEANKLTVLCGSADPIYVVNKLRKRCCARIVSVVPTVDEKKKKEVEEKKKMEEKKKLEEKKKEEAAEKEAAELMRFSHTPHVPVVGYYVPPPYYGVEENANACAIM